ncbi:MAG: LacI family transcriptional regulator [Lachnospiraceae bacterium]|nr:LacI family transcriptional regulator [Lachnospiraceae bacterium]
MTRMQDIADKLGISKGTVSKALNGTANISEELHKNIVETAVEMGYTKKLRRQKNEEQKLCILIDNIEYQEPHHFSYDIILGFRQMAEPAGFTIEIIHATDKLQKEAPYDVFMLQNNYKGALVMGFALDAVWMKDFHTSRTPTVFSDNYIMANPAMSYVGVDNTEGMNLAVFHLKHLGHRKIGYLSTSLGSYIMQIRHDAFFHALRQAGLNSDPSLARNSLYLSECMGEHLPALLDAGVSAIICSHDQMANAVILQCQQLGYHIPNDISIVGFDDLPFCAYTSPPLTTIRQDRILLGKSAFYALDSAMNGISIGTLLLHAQLMIRKSTGEVRNHPGFQV